MMFGDHYFDWPLCALFRKIRRNKSWSLPNRLKTENRLQQGMGEHLQQNHITRQFEHKQLLLNIILIQLTQVGCTHLAISYALW